MISLFLVISIISFVGIVASISGILWFRQHNRFLTMNHYNNGVSHLQAGEYLKAVNEFKAALSRQKTLIEARYGLGLAYMKQRRYREGIEVLETVIRAMPRNAIAHYNLGRAYINVGNLDDAQRILETALHINPHIKEIYFNLSRVFQEKGDVEQAKRYCHDALQLDENYTKAKEYLNFLTQIRYTSAIDLELIQKALQNFDHNDTEFMIQL
jgi:tetratricopeptide (TPR) repeat protein